MRYGCIETGGTKMVLAVVECDGPEDCGRVVRRESLPTEEPAVTLPKVAKWFEKDNVDAFGVAAFGPICVDKNKAEYGQILETTKEAWRYTDILQYLKPYGVPIGLDSDVNGSCLGEANFGAGKGLENVLYLTVGTGIGAGITVSGNPVHGMLHPEAGHVPVAAHPKDGAPCICPYHRSCCEGMASGTAMNARWKISAKELPDDHIAWEIEADYLAQALASFVLTVSPNRIILGGGVMHRTILFPLIRKKTAEYLGGYLVTKELSDMDTYIVPAELGDDQGIFGCRVLAERALTAGR